MQPPIADYFELFIYLFAFYLDYFYTQMTHHMPLKALPSWYNYLIIAQYEKRITQTNLNYRLHLKETLAFISRRV